MTTIEARREGACTMTAIAEGDRGALMRLMDRHSRGLRGVAARFLGNEEEAEEVVQDVFIRVWRKAHRYDPAQAAVSTWLYRIAVNLCIDRQRRRTFRQIVGLEEVVEDLADPAPSAEVQVADRARLAATRQAITALPGRQRMALLLAVVAEFSTVEIAAAMETSAGSVEQLLVRARRSLRGSLAASERERGDEST
ncbi:MAG: sigma-70 family RNA polymerase sigma factor [Pseudomonadota bacterium]